MKQNIKTIRILHKLSCIFLIIVNLAIASIPFLLFHEVIPIPQLYILSFSLICTNTICCLSVIITTIKRSYYNTLSKILERDQTIALLANKLNESINIGGEVMINSNFDPMNGLELIYDAYLEQEEGEE